jgi:tRNA A37 threonylcarbamoyladenosine biosynthesis protein TsaE
MNNPSAPKFISISGVAGSGKTTVSDYLKSHFRQQNYTINDFSFAGPLKDALCLWFGWDRKRLDSDFAYKEGSTLDDGSPDPFCERLGMTRRQIMQKMGTECMRQGMHPNFWIIMADLGVHLGRIPHSDIYVISDARFLNELEWAKSINGYRLLVMRAECQRGEDPDQARTGHSLTTHTKHASETEFLQFDDYDETVVNLIDHNRTNMQNMNALIAHLDTVTIPAIRERHNLSKRRK